MRIFNFFLFLFFVSLELYSQEIILNPQPKEVVMYPNYAFIKRQSSIKIKKGSNEIWISPLPEGFLDTSLQVHITKGNTEIQNLQIWNTYLRPIKIEKLEKLKSKLNELIHKILELENEKETYNISIQTLKKLTIEKSITIQDIKSFLQYQETKILENLKKITNLQNQLNELHQEKKKIEEEINMWEAHSQKTKIIQINLNSNQDQEIMLEVGYLQKDAYWKPSYEIKIDPLKEKAFVSMKAEIYQNTGEDWKDVSLTLSTQEPHFESIVPELPPWYLEVQKEVIVPYRNQPEAFFRAKKETQPDETPLAENQQITKIHSDISSFEFQLPGKYLISSNQKPQRVQVISNQSQAKIQYLSVPKLRAGVFVVVKLENPFDFPLSVGEANVFFDDKYKNKVFLEKPYLPKEEISIPIGTEERIKIERKLERKFTEIVGTFKKQIQIHYEFSLKIKNTLPKEVEVEMMDQIPVSKHEMIEVSLLEPKQNFSSNKQGIIKWKVPLKQNQEKKLDLKFLVRYP